MNTHVHPQHGCRGTTVKDSEVSETNTTVQGRSESTAQPRRSRRQNKDVVLVAGTE